MPVPTPKPTPDPTREPTNSPSSPAPTAADASSVVVSFAVVAAAEPSVHAEALLKATVAAEAHVAESDVKHFAIVTTADTDRRLSSHRLAPQATEHRHEVRTTGAHAHRSKLQRVLTSSYTWDVSFEVTSSLAAVGEASPHTFAATLASRLASIDAAFNAALSQAGTSSPLSVHSLTGLSTQVAPRGSPPSAAVTTLGTCFHGASSTVTLEGGGRKLLADLELGDRILTLTAPPAVPTGVTPAGVPAGAAAAKRALMVTPSSQRGYNLTFAPVVRLPHARNEEEAEFLTLTTASGKRLVLTPDHLLPLCDDDDDESRPGRTGGGRANAKEKKEEGFVSGLLSGALTVVAARTLGVGSCVYTVDRAEQVASLASSTMRGVYTAVAEGGGFLVVNGVVASPYGVDRDTERAYLRAQRQQAHREAARYQRRLGRVEERRRLRASGKGPGTRP